MNAITPDTQLEYELQDLYISSKHWLSDVGFINDEMRFFNDVLVKYVTAGIKNARQAAFHHCKMMLFQQEFNSISLKNNVTAYLNFLAPFITNAKKKIGVDLIEMHTLLEIEAASVFKSLKLLKQELFLLTGEVPDEQKSFN